MCVFSGSVVVIMRMIGKLQVRYIRYNDIVRVLNNPGHENTVCLGVYTHEKCVSGGLRKHERKGTAIKGTYCEDVSSTLHVKQLNGLVVTQYGNGVNILSIIIIIDYVIA